MTSHPLPSEPDLAALREAAERAADFLTMLGGEWQRKYGEPVTVKTQGEVVAALRAALAAANPEPDVTLRNRIQDLVDHGPHWSPHRSIKKRLPLDPEWGAATVAVADLRAALAAANPEPARDGYRIAMCPHCGEQLSVEEPARDGLDELRELVAEMAPDYHAYGLINHHADPNDKTGWHVKGIETCGDPLCVEAVRLVPALAPDRDAPREPA